MRTEESEDRKGSGRLLLRELRSPHNARYLRALPPFRLDDGVPDMLGNLLEQLEEAETRGGAQGDVGHNDGFGDAGPTRANGAVHAPSAR